MQNSYITPAGFGALLLSTNSPSLLPVCHDGDDSRLGHESRLRSGTYLATIATELDNLAAVIDDDVATGQLGTLVNELLYAQEHYELVKRTKPEA